MSRDEEAIRDLQESSISFHLSGPNERLSPQDQSDAESVSSGDSVVHSRVGSRGDDLRAKRRERKRF